MAQAISRVHPQLYVSSIAGPVQHGVPDDVDIVSTVCQDSVEDHIPEGVEYRFFKMSDGPSGGSGRSDYDFFVDVADCLLGALVRGATVLIHCHAGQSRSVSVGIAAIGAYEEQSYRKTYRQFDEERPQIMPDSVLEAHAQEYLGEEPDGIAQRMRERQQERDGQ